MTDRVGNEITDDAQAAALLGSSPAMVFLWRQMGMAYFRVGDQVHVYSSGALVGRQHLDEHGHPVGVYEVIVNERDD